MEQLPAFANFPRCRGDAGNWIVAVGYESIAVGAWNLRLVLHPGAEVQGKQQKC